MVLRIATTGRLKPLVVLIAGLLLAGVALVAPASAATPATADSSHPYSDPAWFPLHVPVIIGCVGGPSSNNGPTSGHNPCATDHQGYFAMNIDIPEKLPGGATNPVPHPAVYAAGAGLIIRAHTGSATCVRSGSLSPGNEVWVYHGGGILSVYQHLSRVNVKVGELVTPRTAIGTAGTTGDSCGAGGRPGTSYLDFQVRRDGGASVTATSVTFGNLYGCAGTSSTALAWPAALTRATYTRPGGAAMPRVLPKIWVQVPYRTGIAIHTASWNCVRVNGNGSPSVIAAPRESRSGSRATVTWSPVAGANRYDVQLQVLRSSGWTTPCSPYVTRGCTYGYYALATSSAPHFSLTGLTSGVHYRLRVSAHNSVGWGLDSGWRDL